MPGNDVCADIRHASFNGVYGNGSKDYPYPLSALAPSRTHLEPYPWLPSLSNARLCPSGRCSPGKEGQVLPNEMDHGRVQH